MAIARLGSQMQRPIRSILCRRAVIAFRYDDEVGPFHLMLLPCRGNIA
jgi:hypothetical protein